MAKYLSSLTTSAVNRYGGVVLGNSGPHRTIRAWASPKRSARPGPAAAHATASQAQYAYDHMTDALNANWELFTGWWYPRRVGGFPVYHNSNTLFTQCFVNAATLGVALPGLGAPTNPTPPPTILVVVIQYAGPVLECIVFPTGGVAMSYPWVVTIKPYVLGQYTKPQPGVGLSLGGSVTGARIDLAAAWVAAFGQLPPSGTWHNVTVTPLYRDWYAPGTVFAQTTRVI